MSRNSRHGGEDWKAVPVNSPYGKRLRDLFSRSALGDASQKQPGSSKSSRVAGRRWNGQRWPFFLRGAMALALLLSALGRPGSGWLRRRSCPGCPAFPRNSASLLRLGSGDRSRLRGLRPWGLIRSAWYPLSLLQRWGGKPEGWGTTRELLLTNPKKIPGRAGSRGVRVPS